MEEIHYIDSEKIMEGRLPAEQAEEAKVAWNMLEFNQIPGLIHPEYYYFDDMICFKYDMSSYHPIKEYLNRKEAGFEEVRILYGGILRALESGMAYLLEEKDYLLKEEWIFWNRFEKKVVLCYLPGRNAGNKRELLMFAEYILQHICHKDLLAVEAAYGFYDRISSNDVSIEEMLIFLREIEERESKERYADEAAETLKREDVKKEHWDRAKPVGLNQKNQEKGIWTQQIWHIGRGEENDICIPFARVSRKHLKVWKEAEGCFITELSSGNGTKINGKKISGLKKVRYHKGDKIILPDISFRLDFDGEDLKLFDIRESGKIRRFLVKCHRNFPKFHF